MRYEIRGAAALGAEMLVLSLHEASAFYNGLANRCIRELQRETRFLPKNVSVFVSLFMSA